MKIAYIIPRFYPFKGGAEQNILSLAIRMVEKGYDVTVFTTNVRFKKDEPLNFIETYKGIKIIRNWALNNQLYAGFYPALLPSLIFNQFDIIHSSGIGFLWREICLIIKKILSPKTKFITTPHGPFMALGDTKGIRGFVKKYYTLVLRIFLPKLYDGVIEVNPKQIEWMVKDYNISKEKIVLVPNGIDYSYIESNIIEHNQDEPIIISYVNRLEYYKGIQDVITVLSKLKYLNEKLPIFIIMGRPGSYAETLYQMVKDYNLEENVKFITSPSDQLRDEILYERSQVNILPSKWEATGISLIEAMAKGNLIITTKGNESYDLLIKEGISGYVYEFSDLSKLSSILNEIIQSPTKVKQIRISNLEFAKQFSWEKIFPIYQSFIIKILSN